MKKFLKGVKKFMQEKIEAAKEVISSPLNRFIVGSAILGLGVCGLCLGGSMIATCFMPQFN